MKKQYKVLISVFVIEVYFVHILGEIYGKVQSLIGNALGLFVVFLPLEILLFQLGRDESFSKAKRMCAKFAFWYIIFVYVLCIIIELVR